MKRIFSFTFHVVIVSLGVISQSSAAPIYGSEVRFGVCDNNGCSNIYNVSSALAGVGVSSDITNETYQDLRYYGFNSDEPVSTTLSFSGNAQSSSAGLKAAVSGEQFSEAYTPNAGDIVQSGMAQYSVASYASFADSLHVTGAIDLSYVKFNVNIHGTRANAPFGSFIQVAGSGVNFSSNDSMWDGIDEFDILTQSAISHLDKGIVGVALTLETILDFYVGGEAFDNDFLGMFREVDFFNTITFGQFSGFNAAGDLVNLSSVTGSDGSAYDVLHVASSAVPEPSAIWLMSLGLIGLIGMSKKNKNNHTLLA